MVSITYRPHYTGGKRQPGFVASGIESFFFLGKRSLFPPTGRQRVMNNYWQVFWLASPNILTLFIIDEEGWGPAWLSI